MRKQSLMGSSEFEYQPNKLDEKIGRRNNFMNYAIREMQGKLDSLGCNYQRNGLGAIENFQKEIIIELLKEWRKRYE